MRETKVASRYALALFRTALASGNLEIIAADLNQIRSFVTTHKIFLEFLKSPSIADEDKEALLRNIFTTRLAPQLVAFLELLLRKHRIDLLVDIAAEFERRVEEHRGVIKARVVTAVHIDSETKDRLREQLERYTGKKIEIAHRIDKSIIGGMVVHLHHQVIDRSVRHQLDLLKDELLKVKVH